MIVLSSDPYVVEFDSRLPDVIFNRLMEIENYTQSLGWNSTLKASSLTDYRTSHSYYDTTRKFSTVSKMLLSRLYEVTGHEYYLEQTEEIQLTKYNPGEYYKRHWDNFNTPGVQSIENDRIGTIILYLNDDFEGGETTFNQLEISIKPKRGKVCYFYYPMGSNTEMLEHEAMPVINGEKKIIQIWIRNTEWTGQQV